MNDYYDYEGAYQRGYRVGYQTAEGHNRAADFSVEGFTSENLEDLARLVEHFTMTEAIALINRIKNGA